MADLNELLDTISDFLNYDFSDLTNAADKLTGFNIIDLIDSLDLSTLIKGLTVSDNSLSVVLGKELLGLNNDFVISLNRDTKLNSISLNDISISGVVVNANLMLNEGLEEIVVPSDYKYYDLSSLNPLVKAIFNTALLGEFNITSNINVKATIIGIDINMNVPLSLNVKLEKGSNLPVVKLQMQIPVIVGVNEDVPYLFNDILGSENRILTIYYKDHNIYIHRTETKNTFVGNGRTYEKKLWLDEETFFDNVLDYLLDFGFGFSDSIMDAILESLDTGEYLIDYTNVLLDFDASVEEGRHSLTINLAEIANNPQLDKFTINLFTNNIDDKSYLTKATFDVNMPVASGVNFTISTSDLALNNIGEAVDLSDLETYIATYPYEKGLFYQYQDNKWVLASEERNLVLDMAGFYDNVTLTGLPSSKLDLPTFDTYIEKDGKLY